MQRSVWLNLSMLMLLSFSALVRAEDFPATPAPAAVDSAPPTEVPVSATEPARTPSLSGKRHGH